MYKIKKEDGSTIGLTESPNYIKVQKNGCFGLCEKEEANGMVHNGTVYHLAGKQEIPESETITLQETDAGGELASVQVAIDALTVAALTGSETGGEENV